MPLLTSLRTRLNVHNCHKAGGKGEGGGGWDGLPATDVHAV